MTTALAKHETHSKGARSENVMTSPESKFTAVVSLFRRMGPYLLLELLMPGGTILALLLFLYRRGALANTISVLRADRVVRMLDAWLDNIQLVTRGAGIASACHGGEHERDGLEALVMVCAPQMP